MCGAGNCRLMEIAFSCVELDDQRSLHIRCAGRGKDLVFLHSALTTGSDWLGPPLRELGCHGRLTIPDRPGHGLSRRPRFEGSPRRQARQIHEGLRRFGVDRPVIVAHSLGALVALAFAEEFPDSLDALVLVAPLAFPEIRPLEQSIYGPRSAPVFGPALSSIMTRGPDAAILQSIHRLMFWPEVPPDYWEANYPWAWMLSEEAGVASGEEFSAILPVMTDAIVDVRKITAPTEIIVGSKDAVVRPSVHGEPLATLLSDCSITRLREGGHMLHHTHAADVARAVSRVMALPPDRAGEASLRSA